MKDMEDFFEKLDLLAVSDAPEPNLFSASGPGHHENRLSDLMALFMGSHEGAPRWLARALVVCLARKRAFQHESTSKVLENTDWSRVYAEREVTVWDGEEETTKRLDIVLVSDTFVVGVEHKVWASALHNPFDHYTQLIDSYGIGCQARCVLRPSDESDDVVEGWSVVSYQELLSVAYELYGQEVAHATHDKWQVFYQELLQHLDSIANPKEAIIMDPKELSFSLKHFHYLREAASYLERLEKELIQEGKSQVAAELSMADTEINVSFNTWGDGQRVLRFFPARWEGTTQVCLVYYTDAEESEADETIGFYIRAYVEEQGEPAKLERIGRDFRESVPSERSEELAFYQEQKGESTWYESNRRYLALDAWPADYTKAGAMVALGDLARWVDERVTVEQPQPVE